MNLLGLGLSQSRFSPRKLRLGLGLSQSRFSPRKLRPSLYLSADRGVYQDAAVQFTKADKSFLRMATPFDPGTDDFIVSFWVWLDSASGSSHSVVVDTGAINENAGFGITASSFGNRRVGLWFKVGTASRVYDYNNLSVALALDQWHNITVVFDRSGTARVYVNGITNGNTLDISGNQATLGTQAANAIGSAWLGSFGHLDGRIDSLMFFKKADLSAVADDIIAWAYNGGSGRLCAEITDEQKAAWGAVSGWEFAEQSGQRKDSWGTNHLSEELGEEVTEIARAPGIVRAIAANGDGVSYWRDQSTGGKHAAQITLAKRPTLVTDGINSRPVIRGDGVDDYLGHSAVSLTGAFTISAVFQSEANPSAITLLGKDANNYVTLTDNTTVTVCIAGSSQAFTVGAMGTDPHILTVTRDADDAVNVYLDGTVSSTGAKTVAGTLALEQVMANAGGYFAGDLAEFLVYDGEKTAAELARIHTYLARRYGITI